MISNLKFRSSAFLFFAWMGTLLFSTGALAQRGNNAYEQAASKLPPDAQAVVTRLASLSTLPGGGWKMHLGDVAHGEAVNLDDSDWQTVNVGAQSPDEAVWFRRTIEVPQTLHGYSLAGARIWFQFRDTAHGPITQILYVNGRRVALGEDLEPIVLFDNAKPGEKAVVAVKMLESVGTKTFRGAMTRIDFPADRPNPDDLRQEFLSAAVLLPALAPGDSARETTLEDAIKAIDIGALDTAAAGDAETQARAQMLFDASLKKAQTDLDALRPLLQQATFHLTGNSHIDAAWLWPWTETVDVVHRTFGTALQLMNEYPDYTYTQSAAQYNEWMAEKYPEMNDEIKKRIKEGRWEVVGGMWVEPDLNLPNGESQVRQLLVGKRWYEKNYGVDVHIGWNPDSFGYNWQLPQIYKKSGVDYFVTQKMSWNDTNQLPFKLFWWESPDGSKVLTYFPHGYGNRDLGPVRLSEDLATALQFSPGLTDMMDLYGVGDHGGGPTRAMLDQGFHWADQTANSDGVTPKYQFGTALPYFTKVEKEIALESPTWNYQSIAKGYTPPPAVPGKISIPTWDSELYLEFHRGVYTTQSNHKRNMRRAEEEMLDTEKWASLAWLDGQRYPNAQLTEDWEKVLFNQFHDLAAGSGIGIIYKDAQQDYDWVRMSTDRISASSLQTVTERIDTQNKRSDLAPVVIYNPLGWARSGEVTVHLQLPAGSTATAYRLVGQSGDAEHSVATVVHRDAQTGEVTLSIDALDVPALGYKVVWVDYSAHAPVVQPKGTESESGDTFTLENADLRVVIDRKTGCITSLYDKRGKFETLAANSCGNELEAYKDLPKQYDAWNIDPGTYDETPTLLTMTDSVAAEGPFAVRVARTWQNSKFVQTISLRPDADYVDVDNRIDWHERHVLLKAAFTLAATSPFATYEIPYGTIERPTTRNNSWEKAQFEVPAQRWADLGDGKQGFSLLNQSKYGYDAVGNELRLTLLRSPTYPDPEADQGRHHFHYALYPHAGSWKDALTVRHGWGYNFPLKALATMEHAGSLPAEHSFAAAGPDNVVLTAVKKAEDAKGLIFRVYEWAGKDATVDFHVPPGATGATVTNLMEKPEGDPLTVADGVVKVPIHPYEILTVRVNYPDGGPKEADSGQ
jgi:alpha-mannosidase